MISVIIVNWNAGAQLRACVDSVLQYGRPLIDQIVVVDNGSTDKSEADVESLSGITLIRAGTNLGFAKACNLGAAQLNSEFLLFLNPDARLFPDTLSKALKYLRRPENAFVGICGVQLVDEDGKIARSCARYPSLKNLTAYATGLDRIVPRLGHSMAEWDHATIRQVDQVIGAFFLVRKCVYDLLQGFDETFFVYFEEVDFSYRAKQMGWNSVYLADVRAFHAGGGTSNQVKAKRLFYSLRSRILYAFKHFNVFQATSVLLATLLIESVSRSMLAVGRRSWTSLRETWAAYTMLARWLPNWLFKGTVR